MNVHFALASLDRVVPWTIPSQNNRGHLSWFGLTEGTYWIEVGGHQLLRYSEAVCQHWADTYPDIRVGTAVDYYVVRLWEDLLTMLPAILEPVPDDLARFVSSSGTWATWQRMEEWADRARTWYEDAGNEEWDCFYTARGWWGERQLDSAYLKAGFGLWLWRTGDTIHLRWDNEDVLLDGIPAWAETYGESSLSVSDFVETIKSFDTRFLAAIGERVNQVRANGGRSDVKIDLDGLVKEQADRSTWMDNALARSVPSDWDGVREAMARIAKETT